MVDHGRVVRRHQLSDAEREFVCPLLPRSGRGRKRLDDRAVLNGIVRKFWTGTAWRDVPEWYGCRATLHTRFRRWVRDGTFERMLREAQARADAAGEVDWPVSVDSTVSGPTSTLPGPKTGLRNPALGRSRGGLTSKIHLVCDALGEIYKQCNVVERYVSATSRSAFGAGAWWCSQLLVQGVVGDGRHPRQGGPVSLPVSCHCSR
ncbi:transposase [Streptomyces sp. A 4/2]|uniref:transposase n=1 Tax=Streptomyces sp. A 4/2 TaxID=2934314 RepID=UPI0020244682|nr:transposase [Streptomyces sp. A 4/2]